MSKSQAIEIARRHALSCGWHWIEPIYAKKRVAFLCFYPTWEWEVISNADRRGGNVRILIRDHDQTVVKAVLLSR
jgi:hypothetical protein